jgi:non-homologous end joining protein Ku
MRGTNANLVITTTTDEVTGEAKPLFGFPIQICKATGSQDVKFDRVAPSGAAYETCYKDTATGELVEYKDLLRGVKTGDSFQQIPDEAIKAINEALASKEIVVERSVNLSEVPFERATGAAYLQVPTKGGSAKFYRLVYEALTAGKKPKALRVKYVSRTRQKLGVIYADTNVKCLVLVTLTFAADVREPDEQVLSPLSVEVEQPMVTKLRKVIDALDTDDAGDWTAPADEAIDKRKELVETALAGEGIEVEPKREADVVEADELDALLDKTLETVG